MNPLFDLSLLSNFSYKEKLPFSCCHCFKIFKVQAKWVKRKILQNTATKTHFKFCSIICMGLFKKQKITTNCGRCNKSIDVEPSVIKKSKSGKNFCSRSCAATYNNTHKTTGTRRSKLEVWLEDELTKTYSNLEIHFNRKDTIDSELDIYIPKLKVAFELNGIFHYKPIYGEKKFLTIQLNDKKKIKKCLEHQIQLSSLNLSLLKRFAVEDGIKIFNIICNIINKNVARLVVFETTT